jgi:hypothetical protein
VQGDQYDQGRVYRSMNREDKDREAIVNKVVTVLEVTLGNRTSVITRWERIQVL